MKKIDEISKKFPDKQINRLVCFRKSCPLKFSERIVYSFLLYRCRRKGKMQPASIRKLSKLSGLHRDTISRALIKLSNNMLVKKNNNKWHVIKEGRVNNPDWFAYRGSGRESKDLAYHYFPQPNPNFGLSIIDSLIYLSDLTNPSLSNALLSGRFSISWSTVKSSRKKLANKEFSSDWFMNIEFKKKPVQDLSTSSFIDTFSDGGEKQVVKKMLEKGFTQADVEKFFGVVKVRIQDEERYFNFIYRLIGSGENSFDHLMKHHAGKCKGVDYLLIKLRMLEPSVQVAQ